MRFFNTFYADVSRGKRRAAFYDDVVACANELWGVTRKDIEDLHLVKSKRVDELYGQGALESMRQAASCGLISVSASRLWPQWRDERNPVWLYSHPHYKWDSLLSTIGGSIGKTERAIDWFNTNGYKPERIYDWGAGPGLTSLLLARAYPHADVHFNEYPDSPLVQIFNWFRERFDVHNTKHVAGPIGSYDMIEALEIVEHFPLMQDDESVTDENGDAVGDAYSEAKDLFSQHLCEDGYLIWNTVFAAERNNDVLGHFRVYDIDGVRVPFHRAGAAFRKAIASSPLNLETALERKFVDGVWVFRRPCSL